MPPKRKRSTVSSVPQETPISFPNSVKPLIKRAVSRRGKVNTNPDQNHEIIDGKAALRASPDADEKEESLDVTKVGHIKPLSTSKTNGPSKAIPKQESDSDSPLSDDLETLIPTPSNKKVKKAPTKSSIAAKKGSDEIKAFRAEQAAKKLAENGKVKKEDEDEWDRKLDPDGDEGPVEDVDLVKKEAARPPPVNSDYLPLPWKGRLGYACLNTYLRFSNPPVFTSRTCRIASILEHRHPLRDPSQPEHATKNRPDKTQSASIERGQRYVEELCLANIRDIPKMIRWNDKYGIKFMRLSSEMFPFASHAEYGYKLAPFASESLAEVGNVIGELGHRVSTHPGQFTQLGSPRAEVIANAYRDLEYHDEMLSLLKLPEQTDRDAVMILHMGGTFGDKAATLDRFRNNYDTLSPSIKNRLVLENDDVSWSVHDLLPICEELNIPLCLDFHHHNIIFDASKVREGTLDIISLYPRIKATWDRKKIRQKMHYSEPCPGAITRRQRRKHNPRPMTLPPCADDMDLMIEAKDKEQAVFELMRMFKLPGWERANAVVPYERQDDNKPVSKKVKKKIKKEEFDEEEEVIRDVIPENEVGMGGRENRVYWPQGMEEWLRPMKRTVKKKSDCVDEEEIFRNPTPGNFKARKTVESMNKAVLDEEVRERLQNATCVGDVKMILEEINIANLAVKAEGEDEKPGAKKARTTPAKKKVAAAKKNPMNKGGKNGWKEEEDEEEVSMPDLSADEVKGNGVGPIGNTVEVRKSGRSRGGRKSYVEVDGEM